MYWGGAGLWAMVAYPMLPLANMQPSHEEQERLARENQVPEEDLHLRSTAKVAGYGVAASDDSIGEVKDFVFDDESWSIRYRVIDTGNWWPGKKVLVATRWIDRIDWTESKVYTKLSRDEVKASPEYDETRPLDRDYETRLHEFYRRPGYWS